MSETETSANLSAHSDPDIQVSQDGGNWANTAYDVIAFILCVFVLVGVNTTLLNDQPNLAIFGLLGLTLTFLRQPMFKRWQNSRFSRIADYGLIAATVVVFGYILVQSSNWFQRLWIDGAVLGERAGNETSFDFVIALIGLLLVLEATRRTIGWTLPILCCLFIAYAWFGQSMPDWAFPHRGASWQQIAQKTFLQEGGVFGTALRVMFLYVFLFVLFGTLLEQTGATGYVIRFARRLFRNSSGGPAKVAVVSSGLMGSLSGSAVANTATTGTFTIPLMKSSGFRPETAAGVEAAASSGGALAPPVMGAGAYMMLEVIDPPVQYYQIMLAAVIPAVMYYAALLLTVHFHSKRVNASAEPGFQDDDNGSQSEFTPWQGIVFFGSFILLIVMLLNDLSPFTSVSISFLGILALSVLHSKTRIGPRQIYVAMVAAASSGVTLIVAASCVGIILGVVSLTGLGASFPAAVQGIAEDGAIVALLLLMVSTLILGMGLPSAVCYLLVASLIGDVLTTLETPPLAAHLFIFYFGMMSMVTPPVALAAYAGAAIAKADVIRSAFAAFRFALVGFALPFAFVLRPELIMLTPDNTAASPVMIVAHVATTLVAIVGLSSAIAGFAFARTGVPLRIGLLLASLLVFFTRWQGIQMGLHFASVVTIVFLLATNFVSAGKQDVESEVQAS